MSPRLNISAESSEGLKGLMSMEQYLHRSGIERSLLHLVKLRASQINQCAYCIDMHWKDLRAIGESEQRLYGLGAWEESPYYSERERAALRWTDAITRLHEGHVSDEVFEAVRPHFNDKELSDLTLAIVTINAWNRIAISSRTTVGNYQSSLRPAG